MRRKANCHADAIITQITQRVSYKSRKVHNARHRKLAMQTTCMHNNAPRNSPQNHVSTAQSCSRIISADTDPRSYSDSLYPVSSARLYTSPSHPSSSPPSAAEPSHPASTTVCGDHQQNSSVSHPPSYSASSAQTPNTAYSLSPSLGPWKIGDDYPFDHHSDHSGRSPLTSDADHHGLVRSGTFGASWSRGEFCLSRDIPLRPFCRLWGFVCKRGRGFCRCICFRRRRRT